MAKKTTATRSKKSTRFWIIGPGIAGIVAAVAAVVALPNQLFPDDPHTLTPTTSPTTSPPPPPTSLPDAAQVTITCDKPPARLRPGQQITIDYRIRAGVSGAVGLGAGFYDDDGRDHSTGLGDVDHLVVQTTGSNGTRQFKVGDDVPPGTYELVIEAWPANEIGSAGTETLAEATCGHATVS